MQDPQIQNTLTSPYYREVLSVKEMAEYLGLSESIIRRLVKQNEIPFLKIIGTYKFYLPKIREWLAQQSAVTLPDTNKAVAEQKANDIWQTTQEN